MGGRILILYLSMMESLDILHLILPEDLVSHFTLVSADSSLDQLVLHLDENKIKPPEHFDKQLESKGFTDSIIIHDFPIRNKPVLLKVRRRKWKDLKTGKVYTRNWSLKHPGTSYTKDFALFLKKMSRL
jgi:hypothetical protein